MRPNKGHGADVQRLGHKLRTVVTVISFLLTSSDSRVEAGDSWDNTVWDHARRRCGLMMVHCLALVLVRRAVQYNLWCGGGFITSQGEIEIG